MISFMASQPGPEEAKNYNITLPPHVKYGEFCVWFIRALMSPQSSKPFSNVQFFGRFS